MHSRSEKENAINERIEEILEQGFTRASKYSRVPLPTENSLEEFDTSTRQIVVELLRRTLDASDTYTRHHELDYPQLHSLQLDLLNHIVYCEKSIQTLRSQYKNSKRVDKLKQRRKLLRLLGSSIAWILLEFDAAYIRAFSQGHDQGYIIGKDGSPAEVLAFIAGGNSNERTTLIHHVTQCLKIGDLTFIEGNFHYPIEIKTNYTKKGRRLDRRERRQKKRGDILVEYYAKRRSKKLIPGITVFRRNTRRRDVHHWSELTQAAQEAGNDSYSLRFAEKGIAYGVCHSKEQIRYLVENFAKQSRKPKIFAGSLDHHVLGLPEIMPFTLFEIPFKLKEEILFADTMAFSIIDMKGVCKTLSSYGLHARLGEGSIKIKARGIEQSIGGNLIERLRYECLSTETLRDYALLPIPKALLKKKDRNSMTEH